VIIYNYTEEKKKRKISLGKLLTAIFSKLIRTFGEE
jgi:hypothetical protein